MVFFILLSILIFIHTLHSKTEQLQQNIEKELSLANWIERASHQINALKKLHGNQLIASSSHSKKNTLTVIESSLQASELTKTLSELNQVENNKVHLKFKKVSFDQLIHWLTQLWHQQGIAIIELQVTPQKPPGLVEATLLLSA